MIGATSGDVLLPALVSLGIACLVGGLWLLLAGPPQRSTYSEPAGAPPLPLGRPAPASSGSWRGLVLRQPIPGSSVYMLVTGCDHRHRLPGDAAGCAERLRGEYGSARDITAVEPAEEDLYGRRHSL
jgi:hypothetical protein